MEITTVHTEVAVAHPAPVKDYSEAARAHTVSVTVSIAAVKFHTHAATAHIAAMTVHMHPFEPTSTAHEKMAKPFFKRGKAVLF